MIIEDLTQAQCILRQAAVGLMIAFIERHGKFGEIKQRYLDTCITGPVDADLYQQAIERIAPSRSGKG